MIVAGQKKIPYRERPGQKQYTTSSTVAAISIPLVRRKCGINAYAMGTRKYGHARIGSGVGLRNHHQSTLLHPRPQGLRLDAKSRSSQNHPNTFGQVDIAA